MWSSAGYGSAPSRPATGGKRTVAEIDAEEVAPR